MRLDTIQVVKLCDVDGGIQGWANPISMQIDKDGKIIIECDLFREVDMDWNEDMFDAVCYGIQRYSDIKPKQSKKVPKDTKIKNVIFNEPATVVFWSDGTKTIVKCQDGDIFDPEKGLAMAIAKKFLGNKHSYFNIFKKWLPKEREEPAMVKTAYEHLRQYADITPIDAKEMAKKLNEAARRAAAEMRIE